MPESSPPSHSEPFRSWPLLLNQTTNDDDGGIAPTMTEEEHPRRLCQFPSGEWVAYGGDVSRLMLLDRPTTTEEEDRAIVPRVIVGRLAWDDEAIRAVAVSADGQRVAVGFDSGAITIYAYDDYLPLDEGESASSARGDNNRDRRRYPPHPFLRSLAPREPEERSWAGPCLEAPVRDLTFFPGGRWLACASEAGLCVVGATTPDDAGPPRHLQDLAERHHDGSGLRGLAWAPLPSSRDSHQDDDEQAGVVLASLAMDGRLCWWQVSPLNRPDQWKLLLREKSTCITKKDPGEIFGADAFDRSCLPVALPAASGWDVVLSLPGEPFLQLRLVHRPSPRASGPATVTVSEHNQLSPPSDAPIQGHVDTIITSAGSPHPNDPWIITGGRDGRILLWRLHTPASSATLQAILERSLGTLPSPPSQMKWWIDDQGQDHLYIVCVNGTLVTVHGRDLLAPPVARMNEKNRSRPGQVAKASAESTAIQRRRLQKATPGQVTSAKNHDQRRVDDDDDDEVEFTQNDHHSPAKRNQFIDDEAAEEDDDDDEVINDSRKESPPSKEAGMETGDILDDDHDDLDDDFPLPAAATYRSALAEPSSYPTWELPEPQPPFAPSSTPLDLTRRFLCWNHLGSVTLQQGEVGLGRGTVDIHFTDAAFRRPISFTDNMGFILGSLGEDGGIFATDLGGDDDDDDEDQDGALGEVVQGLNISEATKAALKKSTKSAKPKDEAAATGSTIYFHRFETFASHRDKDWYLTLPSGERALGCSCGEGWAAVVTSRRFLRLFSSGGNQDKVIWLPGEPVTVVGRTRFLATFYHEAAPLPDATQKLGYTVYDGMTSQVLSKGSVACISNGASLSWAGFSNDGSLLAMDSEGLLSMLVNLAPDGADLPPPAWEWVPMLDLAGFRKSREDSYWPITVVDGKFVCVPLKGGTKHPDASRRPVTTTLGLRLPLARGSILKANALEELSIRAVISLGQKRTLNRPEDEENEGDFEKEYRTLCAQVDKVTLKFFAAMVEASKLERALDLVDRLHLEKSYDLAMTIGDSHRKLVELIEDAKERKFGGMVDVADDTPHYAKNVELETSRITPDSIASRKRKALF